MVSVLSDELMHMQV